MRNTKLLRTTSSRNVCVFCACRFNGLVVPPANAPSPAYEQRRAITTSTPLQQHGPSPVPAEAADSSPPPPSPPPPTTQQQPIVPDAASEARRRRQGKTDQKSEAESLVEQGHVRKIWARPKVEGSSGTPIGNKPAVTIDDFFDNHTPSGQPAAQTQQEPGQKSQQIIKDTMHKPRPHEPAKLVRRYTNQPKLVGEGHVVPTIRKHHIGSPLIRQVKVNAPLTRILPARRNWLESEQLVPPPPKLVAPPSWMKAAPSKDVSAAPNLQRPSWSASPSQPAAMRDPSQASTPTSSIRPPSAEIEQARNALGKETKPMFDLPRVSESKPSLDDPVPSSQVEQARTALGKDTKSSMKKARPDPSPKAKSHTKPGHSAQAAARKDRAQASGPTSSSSPPSAGEDTKSPIGKSRLDSSIKAIEDTNDSDSAQVAARQHRTEASIPTSSTTPPSAEADQSLSAVGRDSSPPSEEQHSSPLLNAIADIQDHANVGAVATPPATSTISDNATVEKEDNATVEKEDNATVEKEDNAAMGKKDNAAVEKNEDAAVSPPQMSPSIMDEIQKLKAELAARDQEIMAFKLRAELAARDAEIKAMKAATQPQEVKPMGTGDPGHAVARDRNTGARPMEPTRGDADSIQSLLHYRADNKAGTTAHAASREGVPSRNPVSSPRSSTTAFRDQIEQSRNSLGSSSSSKGPALSSPGGADTACLDQIGQSRNALDSSSSSKGSTLSSPRSSTNAFVDQLEQSRNALGASTSSKGSTISAFDQVERSRNALASLPRYNISRSDQRRDEQSAEPFDPKVTSSWNILKQNTATQQDTQPGSKDNERRLVLGPQDIDAKFEEHRRRRQAPAALDLSTTSFERRARPPVRQVVYNRNVNSQTTPCLRCGQKGHLSRDCHQPFRRVDLTSPPAEASERQGPPLDQRVVRRVEASPYAEAVERNGPSIRHYDASPRLYNASTHAETADRKRPDVPISYHKVISPDREHLRREKEEDDRDAEDRRDRRDDNPRGKFKNTPVPEAEPEDTRRARRSGRFADEDEDEAVTSKPTKTRSNRFDDVEEDDRPSRRRRFEDDEDAMLMSEDYEGDRARRAARKKERQAKKDKAARQAAKAAERKANRADDVTPIRLPEFISVANLVQALNVRYESLVRKMEELGFTNHAHDHVLNAEEASMIALEYNFDPTVGDAEGEEAEERDLKAQPPPDEPEFLPTRPPIVAIMGHVDHGKTTILDFLRKSSVAASEHGGITQHIGAFSVGLSSGKTITFLDTPGHAAFLEMRKRGATVTDIIVLVVAADDSVKPQTIEAIKHAKAAAVPIIVAINKIDKEEADIVRVKQDLARYGVEIEDYGGDTQVVPVSGKTGAGIPDLEENISTLSEILDHRAEPTGQVEGWVLEATTKKAGRVATVLVRRGTLVPGMILVAGKTWTRVRTLRNEAGVTITSAEPGTPVEVDGWRDQPIAGDEALQAPNEQKAADVVDYRVELDERKQMAADMEAINSARREDAVRRDREREIQQAEADAAKAYAEAERAANDTNLTPSKASAALAAAASAAAKAAARKAAAKGEPGGGEEADETNAQPSHQTVPFIIKADVSGSVEAVSAYLLQMSNPLVSPTILRAAVGPVSEFDIEHAAVANGHLISFNLPPSPEMRGNAERRGVRLIEENVIYRIVGDVKGLLEEKLPLLKTQRVVGEAEIAAGFEIGLGGRKTVRIAGCKIRNGVVGMRSRVRVLRGEKKIYDGTVSSLKNVKKDVKEMRKGTECGVGFDGWEDFEVGDLLQTYEEKTEKRSLPI